MTNKGLLVRRDFLKRATQSALAAPMMAMLPSLAEAQESKKVAAAPAAHKAAVPAKPKVMLNVKDYGATGDGKTKDTLAIQQTIERCSVFGGGEVVVPAGDYLTGALALRSGVTLRVEEGATLNGSPDMTDYPLRAGALGRALDEGLHRLHLGDGCGQYRDCGAGQDHRQSRDQGAAGAAERDATAGAAGVHQLQERDVREFLHAEQWHVVDPSDVYART